jgi:hypothetical protein
MNNRTLLLAELGETWETLTQYELKKRELNKNIKTYLWNKAARQHCLRLLNELYNKARSALNRCSTEENQTTSIPTADAGGLNMQGYKGYLKKIEAQIESIPSRSEKELKLMINMAKRALREQQKQLLEIEDEVEWMMRSKGLLAKSIGDLLLLEEKLLQKGNELNPQGYNDDELNPQDYNDEDMVELETLDSNRESPLHQHKIKGCTYKTFVALTEQKV